MPSRALQCHAMRQDVFKAPHECPDAPELTNVLKTYQISQPSTQVSTIGTRTWCVTRKSKKVQHLNSIKKIQIQNSANRKHSFLNFEKRSLTISLENFADVRKIIKNSLNNVGRGISKTSAHAHTYTHARARPRVHEHTKTHTHTQTHTHTHTNTHTSVYIYIYI